MGGSRTAGLVVGLACDEIGGTPACGVVGLSAFFLRRF